MLRLISRFDPAAHSQSPPPCFRRNSREATMVNQRNYQLPSPASGHTSDKIPSMMASGDEAASEGEALRQNVIVKHAPLNKVDENTATAVNVSSSHFTPVKAERLSPKRTSPPTYPSSSESRVTRSQEGSVVPNRQPDLAEINRVREQILKTIGSYSRLQSGDFTALNSFGLSSASMVPILAQEAATGSQSVFGPRGVFIPHSNTGFGQHPANASLRQGKNDETSASRTQGIWLPRPPFGYQHAAMAGYPGLIHSTNSRTADDGATTKTACVSAKTSPRETVSIRKYNGATSSTEPLDLSQSRQQMHEESSSSYRDENSYQGESQANMLVDDGKMNTRCEDSITKSTSVSEYGTPDNIRRKVKTEIVDNEGKEENHQQERSQLTEDLHVNKGQTLLPPYLPFQRLVYDRSLRETLAPYGASWHDLQGAVINPHTFLPHAAFGYLPAALAAKTPLQALASLDPNNLAQQSHAAGIAAGLSQWMNVARAVEKLRGSPMATQQPVQPTRKRKSEEGADSRSTPSENESSKTEITKTAETAKRIRLHESLSEGLHRSVSDDQGASKHKDGEASAKKGLERRNSAPSSSVQQLLRQEDQKRITPVDLHSYTGCLPPHYLHLLQSSGNLPVTWREHALREVTEVYDTKHTFPGSETGHRPTADHSGMTSGVITKNRPTKERNFETDGFAHSQRPEGVRQNESQAFTQKQVTNARASHKELWRPGVVDERDWIAGRLGAMQRQTLGDFDRGATNARKQEDGRRSERVRNSSETESDDEDYIQTLQISDASSDEEDEADQKGYISRNGLLAQTNSLFVDGKRSRTASSSLGVDFGRGLWRKMDLGGLPAFGGGIMSPSVQASSCSHFTTGVSHATPTKLACVVEKKKPRVMNAFSRVYSTANIFNSRTKSLPSEKSLTSELMSHDAVQKSEKRTELIAPRLLQQRCVGGSENHKCSGCSRVKDKQSGGGIQDEETRKLIRDILRQSFKSNHQNSCMNTVTSCQPRLVFSSDVHSPYDLPIDHSRPKGHDRPSPHREENISSSHTSGNEDRSFSSVTSSEAYTHKMFNAARTTKDRKHPVIHDQTTGNKSETYSSATALSIDRVLSPFVIGTMAKRRVSSSGTASSRLNSLDAKLEELRQKAMQATEASTRAKEVNAQKRARDEESVARGDSTYRNPDVAKSVDQENIIPVTVKSELPPMEEKRDVYSPKSPARSVLQQPVAILEPRHRQPILSPFHEGENGRFSTKKNVAVIKPNQSSTERHRKEEKIPEYVCPPKKRHFKRYSPEFYNNVKREASPHNREVRSASPVTRAPFVTTNLLANDEPPRNIRWGSPDRNRRRGSPDRRRVNASSPRSVLTYHIQRNHLKPFRVSSGHAFVLEQNFRKSPRYVTSPRTDAVIVVASRMPGSIGDERDERLEIGDLEISDDES